MVMERGKKTTVATQPIDHAAAFDSRGKFKKGHPPLPGGGRPPGYSAKQEMLRAAMWDAVEPGDIKDVMRAMVKEAKAGDTAAAKLVLERCLGQPQVDVNLHGDILAATSAGLAALLAGAGPRRGS